MVFAGELGRQNVASQQKLRATRQRLLTRGDPGMDNKQSFFKNRPACSSWIALVKPIHVHLFHFLVIFVSDQVHNQDKYLNVF